MDCIDHPKHGCVTLATVRTMGLKVTHSGLCSQAAIVRAPRPSPRCLVSMKQDCMHETCVLKAGQRTRKNNVVLFGGGALQHTRRLHTSQSRVLWHSHTSRVHIFTMSLQDDYDVGEGLLRVLENLLGHRDVQFGPSSSSIVSALKPILAIAAACNFSFMDRSWRLELSHAIQHIHTADVRGWVDIAQRALDELSNKWHNFHINLVCIHGDPLCVSVSAPFRADTHSIVVYVAPTPLRIVHVIWPSTQAKVSPERLSIPLMTSEHWCALHGPMWMQHVQKLSANCLLQTETDPKGFDHKRALKGNRTSIDSHAPLDPHPSMDPASTARQPDEASLTPSWCDENDEHFAPPMMGGPPDLPRLPLMEALESSE